MQSQATGAAVTGDGHTVEQSEAPEPMIEKLMLIDGRLVGAEKSLASVNPATGAVLGHAPDAGVAETEAAIAAARRAFDTTVWSTDVDLRLRDVPLRWWSKSCHRAR